MAQPTRTRTPSDARKRMTPRKRAVVEALHRVAEFADDKEEAREARRDPETGVVAEASAEEVADVVEGSADLLIDLWDALARR